MLYWNDEAVVVMATLVVVAEVMTVVTFPGIHLRAEATIVLV
jgi:hypothetical protein